VEVSLKNCFALFLCFFVFANGAAALETDKCVFTVKCSNESQKFSLEFKSPTSDCTNDDMEVGFKSKRANRKLEMKKAWYFFTTHISKNPSSICKSDDKQGVPLAIYTAGKGRALAFLKTSGRPGLDRVNYILLNTKTGTVLDMGDLGSTKNSFVAVLKTAQGFKLRIVRDSLSFHDQVTCDCDAPFVDDWMQVSIKDDKVLYAWMENPDKVESVKP